jgi:hypothetical protein
MIRRRWTSCLLALAGIIASWPVPAAGQQAPQLIPFPADVKPGGVFYLAGGGFPPGQPLTVTLVCLNMLESLYGRWSYVLPASKIRDGTFSAWKIRAGFPFTRASVPCTLAAPFGDNPFGVTAPLTIWSADTNLQPVKIPLANVHTRPATGTSAYQTFRASTAPGAHLSLAVQYPHLASMTETVRADWTGQVSVRWRIPQAVKRGSRGRIMVSSRLGVFSGLQAVRMLARR